MCLLYFQEDALLKSLVEQHEANFSARLVGEANFSAIAPPRRVGGVYSSRAVRYVSMSPAAVWGANSRAGVPACALGMVGVDHSRGRVGVENENEIAHCREMAEMQRWT
jgi:hypothetical protein